MYKIFNYYENGELVKKKVIELLEPEKQEIEKIGEILNTPKFKELVYNQRQNEFMKLLLEKLKSGERINLLFSGLAGTGKTFSGKMIACELKKPFVYLNGQMTPKKIREMLLNLKENAIVLIDEIHNLSESVAETIYPAIEYNEISDNGKAIKLNNPLFIGTTTEPEKLPKPLLDRFFRVEFEEPTEETIRGILQKMNVVEETISYLVNHTLNIRIIKKLVNYMDLFGERNKESLNKVFKMMRINIHSGLTEEQDKYISYLQSHKIASLRNMGIILRMSEERIKYEIENELLRKGMILITSKGRQLAFDDGLNNLDELRKAEEKISEAPKFHQDSRETARIYLKEHPELKEKFGKRMFELINFMSEKIEQGIEPDLIDFNSFGNDKKISESFKDNYLEML